MLSWIGKGLWLRMVSGGSVRRGIVVALMPLLMTGIVIGVRIRCVTHTGGVAGWCCWSSSGFARLSRLRMRR